MAGQEQHRAWRHHYVPQFLLRNFTDNNGPLHYIDRGSNERRPPAKPKDIGYGRDLYLIPEKENPNIVEYAFEKFESQAAPVIRRVIETRAIPTTKDDWLLVGVGRKLSAGFTSACGEAGQAGR